MSAKSKVQSSKFKVSAGAHRKVQALVPALLKWFGRNARDLPWRRTRDPYAIWVSEIMLQQTQVKTVIPYWERWMRELPTIKALAETKPEHVLKLWEGLGYYSRARNLQKAAQWLVRQHEAQFPRKLEELLALPGVGRYTAGAISSIAFNQPVPILDGNIVRVLARVFAIDQDPGAKPTKEKLWHLAELLVREAASLSRREDETAVALSRGRSAVFSPRRFALNENAMGRRAEESPPYPDSMAVTQHLGPLAGNCSSLNQSLMELGAVLCTPRQPQCARCPLQRHCVGYQRGGVEKLPYRAARPRTVARCFAALVVQHRDRFWVRRRPAGVVNAGLWEFPNREVEREGSGLQDLARLVPGANLTGLKPFGTVIHTITRFRIRLEVYHVMIRRRPPSQAGRWLRATQLEPLAFPSAHRRILQKFMDGNAI
jgi:A/G-specific adenine glycosylase